MPKWSPNFGTPVSQFYWKDFLASVVVFLTALPLCMGIALASGAPIEAGLITGIIGGIVVGMLSGCTFQVSGPAAGLTVLVLEIINSHGFRALGVILIVAGLLQMAGGLLRLAQLFRSVSPAVVNGMLSGIGLLLLCSQFYVMLGLKAPGCGARNLLGICPTISSFLQNPASVPADAMLGMATVVIAVAWQSAACGKLKLLPKELLAVGLVTVYATACRLPVAHVVLPTNIFASLHLVSPSSASHLSIVQIFQNALALALIASAESLLSANAVDRLHTGKRTKYDRELLAQGFGNVLCGFVGALPMTGVIARSGVNVHAGAQSRASAILHGFWLLLAVIWLPGLMRLVPISCLAAILMLAGARLIDIKVARKLLTYGKRVAGIYLFTAATIVLTDLLTGVMLGMVLSLAKLLYTMSRLDIQIIAEPDSRRVKLQLQGAATFISLPKLADALEQVPADCELHICMDHLDYLDHACFELITEWDIQHKSAGGVAVIDCSELAAAFKHKSKRRLMARDLAQKNALALEPSAGYPFQSFAVIPEAS